MTTLWPLFLDWAAHRGPAIATTLFLVALAADALAEQKAQQ